MNMKSILKPIATFALLCGLLGLTTVNDSEGIAWKTWNDGFPLSKSTGKIAMVDCYTEWCGWCKVMDKKTFTDSAVKAVLEEHFVSIKFNPELEGEYYVGSDTFSGRQLLLSLSNNKPSGYPTTFFYIPETNRMFQKAGYLPPDQFLKLLNSMVDYQQSAVKSE
jgi:uncharacterized protein YyaL (SSP411 family)